MSTLSVLTLLAMLPALLGMTGCRRAPDEEMVPRPTQLDTLVTRAAAPLPSLPHAKTAWPEAARSNPVRVRGSTIVTGERRIRVAPLRVDAAVATVGGVYFLNDGELWFTTGRHARSTGFTGLRGLAVSADGRHLGLVDRNHGPSRPGRTGLAAAVVYDTGTGRVRVRSYAGMGGVADPLDAVYEASPPTALRFTDDDFLARTPSGVYGYPLDGGDPAAVEDEPAPPAD